MNATSLLLSVLVLSLFAGTAYADPPAGRSVSIDTVVPTLTLSGTTTGKGKISGGVDVRSSKGDSWDTHIVPSFTVASSDGTASLLKIAGDTSPSGPPEWSAGITFSMVDRNPDVWKPPLKNSPYPAAHAVCRKSALLASPSDDEKAFWAEHAALAADLLLHPPTDGRPVPSQEVAKVVAEASTEVLKRVRAPCATPAACSCSPTELCKCEDAQLDQILVVLAQKCTEKFTPLCEWLAALETPVDEPKLCKKGQALLVPGQGSVRERGRFYRHILALGATYGAIQIKHLDGGTGPTAALSSSTTTHSNVLVGALYTYVAPTEQDLHFSFELPLLFKSSYSPQPTTAKWCMPSGTVTTKDGSGAAQICDEQSVGTPVHSSQIWVAAFFGFASEKGRFRLAGGPTFSYDLAATTPSPWQIGIQVPLYLSLVKDIAGYSGDYEGIVRLVPTFAINNTDKGPAPVGSISLELLGKRTMFGSALYWP